MKTAFLSACLVLAAPNLHADAFKYRQPNGQILITNQPGSGAGKEVSVHRDEYIPPHQRQAALDDLERQKEFVREREQERHSQGPRSGYGGSAVTGPDVSQVQSCLMKITATPLLSPSEEARRKVGCYAGTAGLNQNCLRSVAGTMRLSSQEERYYKSRCPN